VVADENLSYSMNKSTKIIIAVVSLFLVVFVVLYLLNSARRENVAPPAGQSQSYIPDLPDENLIRIADDKSSDEIRNNVSNLSAGQQMNFTGNLDVQELRLVSEENQPVDLKSFQEALGLNINSVIEGMIDSSFYSLISCPRNDGDYDLGIMLNVKHFSQSEKINFSTLSDQISKAMKDWEKTMLKDLHPFLFPREKFSESQISQELVFRDGKYRFASIILPSGRKGSINYQIFGDPMVIATSPECLDKVSSSLIDE
jgi:hypothetical protein